MEMIQLVCPKCGANLSVNAALNEAHCNYCGTKIYMDKSKDYVSMRMADAEYKRAEAEHMRVMHEIELSRIEQEKEKKKKTVIAAFVIAGVILFFIGILIFRSAGFDSDMDIVGLIIMLLIAPFVAFVGVAYGILSGVIKVTLK